MLEIGRTHTLTVTRIDRHGVWMAGDPLPVLLPASEAPPATRAGEQLAVFVYGAAVGQLLATLRRPLAEVGEFALLTAVEVGPHGAFLDWGIGKQLLVPRRKQPERMQVGRQYLVKLCLDRQGRPFGNGRIDDCLEPPPPELTDGAKVTLILWRFTELGAAVIVDGRCAGLLYRDEIHAGLKPGDRLTGYVKRQREDGRLDLTLRQVGSAGVEEAKAVILAALKRRGFLPLHDDSPPEAIRQALGMSKKTFKKALGGLYREGAVELTGEGVRKKAR